MYALECIYNLINETPSPLFLKIVFIFIVDMLFCYFSVMDNISVILATKIWSAILLHWSHFYFFLLTSMNVVSGLKWWMLCYMQLLSHSFPLRAKNLRICNFCILSCCIYLWILRHIWEGAALWHRWSKCFLLNAFWKITIFASFLTH